MRVWQVKTGSTVFTWRTRRPIQTLEFLAQGKLLMVRSGVRFGAHNAMPPEDDTVTIVRLSDGHTLLRIHPFYSISYAIATKDGKLLLVIPLVLGTPEAHAEVRDIATGRVTHRVRIAFDNLDSLDFSLHEHRIAVAAREVEVQVLDSRFGNAGSCVSSAAGA